MLSRKPNGLNRLGFKLGLFMQRNEEHLVALWDGSIKRFQPLSLEEGRLEVDFLDHKEERHLEELKVAEDNNEISLREVQYQLLGRTVAIVEDQTTPQITVGGRKESVFVVVVLSIKSLLAQS